MEDINDCCCWIAPGMYACQCDYGRQKFLPRIAKRLETTSREWAKDWIESHPISESRVLGIESSGISEDEPCLDDEITEGSITKTLDSEIGCDSIQSLAHSSRWVREVTLTQPSDNKQPYDLISAMRKIVASSMFDVTGYIACVELTKEGTPHIHMMLCSDAKYFNSSKIKSFHKFRYTCSPVRNVESFIEYIFKKKDCPLHIDYCKSKGIDQFYASESLPQKEVSTSLS